MSRIGKQPINIPDGVTLAIESGKVSVMGPRGSLEIAIPSEIRVTQEGAAIITALERDTKQSRKSWGTIRALIANMILGVTGGFEKRLELEGIGFKAALAGKNLELALGFSHPIRVPAPPSIDFKIEKNTIIISGISKEEVGRVAAHIRALKKPEPYKGKGIHYVGEVIRRKAGKKAATTTA